MAKAKKAKTKEEVYFPLKFKIKDKEVLQTICGLPVFTMATKKGNRTPTKAFGLPFPGKPAKAISIAGDLRLIPKTPDVENLFRKFPGVIEMTGRVLGQEYYVVVFLTKDWFLSRREDLVRRWVAESLICTPTNSLGEQNWLPLDFLSHLLTEMNIDMKKRKALVAKATDAIVKFNGVGKSEAYQSFTISSAEYTAVMRAILAEIFGVSDKKIALSEYKITNTLVRENRKVLRKKR